MSILTQNKLHLFYLSLIFCIILNNFVCITNYQVENCWQGKLSLFQGGNHVDKTNSTDEIKVIIERD